MLIFTPNRRAARELALALHRGLAGSLIAPTIRALGDLDEGDAADAFGVDALDLKPSIPAARRRGALARLIQAWRRAQHEPDLPPSSALAAADELAGLLDQAAIGDGVDWDGLRDLSLSADLAEHWRISASFLEIVGQAWPAYLAERGATDELTRRRQAAEAMAARWVRNPPGHPVIIAGSTGAATATRILMAGVLCLPRGVIVLPGLDPDLDGEGWEAVGRAPSHPQFTIKATLDALDVQPTDVGGWPTRDESLSERSRRRLINEALAPAESTKGWNQRLAHLAHPGSAHDLVTSGLSGLRLIEAEDESEEALVAALLLRETLESETGTAALVTPEAAVGRRVAAILRRWGVEIAPSSGTPFHRTHIGSFLLLVMRWARDPADPVLLLAMLKHEFTSLRQSRDDLIRTTSALEIAALRGPRLDRTLEALAHRLEHPRGGKYAAAPQKEGADLVRQLGATLHPFASVLGSETIDGTVASEACAKLAMSLAASPSDPTGGRIWSGRHGAMAIQFIEQLGELCGEMGGVEGALWSDFARAVAQRMIAAPETSEHPRIAIWGPLEARLQRRDRMILAGLNEGAWPKAAPVDGFLNRGLRRRIGLPDPDERIGLSAHDFAQMANAPDVVLLRARRVDDKPAVASRWVWRLRTLSAGGLGSTQAAEAALQPQAGADPVVWARSLRHVDAVASVKPPAPRPPADRRALNAFSPSRTVTLIRDPYADYARRILRLKPLRRVGDDVNALERGTAVHDAIDAFQKGAGLSLEDMIADNLVASGVSSELIEFEKPLWLRAARSYLRWLDARAPSVVQVVSEETAGIVFPSSAGEVTLSATADRIELLTDGTLAIIDFKTGEPKRAKQVECGLEPQLALEAAIAARSGFGALAPALTSQLIYFRFSQSAETAKEKNGQPLPLEKSAADVAEAALGGLKRLIASYACEETAYLSKPRAEFAWSVADFDRLARRAEWTVDEGEE